MTIGPTFYSELTAAGARVTGLAWTPSGALIFTDTPEAWTDAEKSAVQTVLAAHNPEKTDPAVFTNSAKAALADSDVTMTRVAEAVALGSTTWTAADVVAFVNWRRALRAIVNGTDTTSTTLPAKPSYPSGT